MEEWKEYKIGAIANFQKGFAFKSSEYTRTGTRIIKVSNLNQDKYSDKDCVFIDKEKALSYEKYRIVEGDIVISTVGSWPTNPESVVGKVSLIRSSLSGSLLNQNAVRLRVAEGMNQRFLYYLLMWSEFGNYITNTAQGSANQASITLEDIRNFKFNCPNFYTQDKIVSILKSLDDKIEVNRKINENLEQQAQALFKSWFVDFEPFKNGEFVESELGMIPKGWRVGRYDEIIESTISGDWGKESPEGNYTHKVACIRGCDFQDIKNGLRGKTPERYILEKNFQTKHFKDKDVLVEISGGTATVSTGRVCPVSQLLIDKFNEDIVCTNFCRLVRPKPSYGAYLYYSWLYKFNNKVMFGYENGTSGIKNFRIKDFTTLEPIVIPSESSLQLFQSMIDKLQMKLQMNGSESQKLASLRDTLLPKLMSGELKVNEIDKTYGL